MNIRKYDTVVINEGEEYEGLICEVFATKEPFLIIGDGALLRVVFVDLVTKIPQSAPKALWSMIKRWVFALRTLA